MFSTRAGQSPIRPLSQRGPYPDGELRYGPYFLCIYGEIMLVTYPKGPGPASIPLLCPRPSHVSASG
jgi:hypothetical protein